MGLVYECERCKGEIRSRYTDEQPCRACLEREVERLRAALHKAAEMTEFEADRTLIFNHCKQAAEAKEDKS